MRSGRIKSKDPLTFLPLWRGKGSQFTKDTNLPDPQGTWAMDPQFIAIKQPFISRMTSRHPPNTCACPHSSRASEARQHPSHATFSRPSLTPRHQDPQSVAARAHIISLGRLRRGGAGSRRQRVVGYLVGRSWRQKPQPHAAGVRPARPDASAPASGLRGSTRSAAGRAADGRADRPPRVPAPCRRARSGGGRDDGPRRRPARESARW
jgi:hypothetical protein